MFITCPDGWVPYVDHCYKIFRETKGWQEALTSCQKEGSHLASIRSLEEHSFIVSGLGYSKCFQVYICLLVFLLVLFCLFVLFAWKKYQLPQMRYRNCINVKHCSQRHARTHKSASVSAVLSFLLQHWCLPLCSNLQTYSTVLMCFALHQCRGAVTQVRSFLSEVLWNIIVNLFSMENNLYCFQHIWGIYSVALNHLLCFAGHPAPRSARSRVSAEAMEGTTYWRKVLEFARRKRSAEQAKGVSRQTAVKLLGLLEETYLDDWI